MRVNGPYQHRRKWRLVVVDSDGTRDVRSFDNRKDAEEAAEAFQRLYCGRAITTIEEALAEYERSQRGRKKPQSITTTMYRLSAFFAGKGALRCDRVSGMDARYAELTETWAVATHRTALSEARAFGAWLVERRYCQTSPMDGVKAVGRIRHGKAQLRIDESRRWLAAALELAPKYTGAVAAMCGLLLGLRASEIVGRTVRDLDDDGRVLWIDETKTEAGKRRVAVPEILRPWLVRLTVDKLPTALLFGRTRFWVRRWALRICEEAGVPPVCAHGLRGTHASLAIEAGASPDLVARSLGHASSAVTLEAYARADSQADATAGSAWGTLRGTRALGH